MTGAILGGIATGLFGFSMGWFSHRRMMRSMFRIERMAQRAQGRDYGS